MKVYDGNHHMKLGERKIKKASKPAIITKNHNINALQMTTVTDYDDAVRINAGYRCCICEKPTDYVDHVSKAFCCSIACIQELLPLAAKQEKEKKAKEKKDKKDKKDKKGIKKSDEKKKERKDKKKKKKEKEQRKKDKKKKADEKQEGVANVEDKEKELVSVSDSSGVSEKEEGDDGKMNVENNPEKIQNREVSRITKNIINQLYIAVANEKEKLANIIRRDDGVKKTLAVITIRQTLIGEYIRLLMEFVVNLKAQLPELTSLQLVGSIGDININIRESFQKYMNDIASSLNDVAKVGDNIITDLQSVQDILIKANERVIELYMRYDEEWVKSKKVFIDGYTQSARWGPIIQIQIDAIDTEFSYFNLHSLTDFETALSTAHTYDRIRADRKQRKKEKKLAKKKKKKAKAEKAARKKRNMERRKKGDDRSRSSSESVSDDSIVATSDEDEKQSTSTSSEDVVDSDTSLSETDDDEIGNDYYTKENRRTLPERSTKLQITPKRKIQDVIQPILDDYESLRKWFSEPNPNDMVDYLIDMVLIISRDVTEAEIHIPDIIPKYYKALEVMFFTITIDDKVSFLQDLINVVYIGLGTLEANIERKPKKSKKEKDEDDEKEDSVKKVLDLSDNVEAVTTYAKYIFGIVYNGIEANGERPEWDTTLGERRKAKIKIDSNADWNFEFMKASKEIIHQYYVMKLENIEVTNSAIRIISDSVDAATTDETKLLDIVTKGELYAFIMDKLIALMQMTNVLPNNYRLDLQEPHLEEDEIDDDDDSNITSTSSSGEGSDDDNDDNSASGEVSEDSSFSL